MPCRTEAPEIRSERRRAEALRLAVEVAGWSRTATDPDSVIEVAVAFEAYLARGAGDDE